jgi:hypothetical protein
MVQVCRHIKPSGQRCKSPAMRDHSFCYFHARVHTRSKLIDPRDLRFPVPEDFAAIQESIAKVLDAIVDESIGPKQSSQILRGLQIAMQTIPRTPAPPTESVQKVTLSKKGYELAPPLEFCPPALEAGISQKALPARTGVDPDRASRSPRRLENVHAEILPGPQQGQLLSGGEKLLRCLNKPVEPS